MVSQTTPVFSAQFNPFNHSKKILALYQKQSYNASIFLLCCGYRVTITMGSIGGDKMSIETTVFSVRMDASVKDSLDAFCSAVGMITRR